MSTACIEDKAPEVDVELGGKDSPNGPTQASKSSSAEMARIEERITEITTQFQAMIDREVEARITEITMQFKAMIDREVEAKFAEQLNARSQSQATPPPQLKFAPAVEATPRLSRVWQGVLVIATFPCPAFAITYALTGKSWYMGMASILAGLSVSCLSLFFLSSPANKGIETALVVYSCLWFFLAISGVFIGSVFTAKEGDKFVGILNAILLPIIFALVHLIKLLRRKIGAFPRHCLRNYISNTFFLEGMLGCLPPIIYFSSESTECLNKNTNYEGNVNDVCGGVILPTESISLFLIFLLCSRIFFIPLTTTKVTPFQLASFVGLSFKIRLQIVLLGIAILGNVMMFGLLSEGPVTNLIRFLWYVNNTTIFALFMSEIISILTRKEINEKGHDCPGTDQGSNRETNFALLNLEIKGLA